MAYILVLPFQFSEMRFHSAYHEYYLKLCKLFFKQKSVNVTESTIVTRVIVFMATAFVMTAELVTIVPSYLTKVSSHIMLKFC